MKGQNLTKRFWPFSILNFVHKEENMKSWKLSRGLAVCIVISWVLFGFQTASIFAGTNLMASQEKSEKESTKDEKSEETTTLETITVTATKTEVDPRTVPFTTWSVERKTMDEQPSFYMNNVGELIRDLPGVHVAQYYPWGPPWIHLRGTGYFIGRTIYLVDGLPAWSFLATTLNPHDVERVDVVLGPSSALYGANASGGAVNFITRSGKKDMGAVAEMAYGSNNTYRPHTHVGDQVGNWNYYLSYSGDYSDGYKMKPVDGMVQLWKLGKKQYLVDASLEDNEYKHSFFSGKVGWDNNSGTKAWVSFNFVNRYLYGGQPNLILDDYGDQAITTAHIETPINSFAKFKLTGAYQYYDHPQQYNGGLSLDSKGNLLFDPTIASRRTWEVKRYPAEAQVDLYLLKDNIFTAGLFGSREDEYRRDDFYKDKKSSTYEVSTDQTAFYIQDQIFLLEKKLSLIGGIRYDRWKFHDIFVTESNPQEPDSVSKDTWTYRGGIKYNVNDMLSVRSSAGTAYWPGTALWYFQRITTGKTWREPNPNLKPEKTWMVDWGADLTFAETQTMLSATGYYGRIRDIVSYRYDENPHVQGGTIIRTQNLGEAEIYGIELYGKQKLFGKLWLTASLTLNHSEIVKDPKNKGHELRNAPDYWGSVGIAYLDPELINTSLLIRFSDDRYYDDENTELPFFHMKSYQTVDLKIWRDWKIAPNWVLTTSISAVNIFDKDYETEIVYVNPGRYVEGLVSVKWLF
jgi:iron complex outermembrane receptor protein